MAIYWLTECIPIGATGLLPVLLLPLLGLMPAKDVASNYWKVNLDNVSQ